MYLDVHKKLMYPHVHVKLMYPNVHVKLMYPDVHVKLLFTRSLTLNCLLCNKQLVKPMRRGSAKDVSSRPIHFSL